MVSKEAVSEVISNARVHVHSMKYKTQNTYVYVIHLDLSCLESEDFFVSKKLYLILAFQLKRLLTFSRVVASFTTATSGSFILRKVKLEVLRGVPPRCKGSVST